MSSSYYLYSEALIDGKWTCLNAYMKTGEKYVMAETYYSGSRTYFSSTFEKLEEIGQQINKDNLSPELQEIIGDINGSQSFFISLCDLQKAMPFSQKYENHGYVEKSIIFLFESEEVENIFEWLSSKEYMELDEEAKKIYQYYEWNSVIGWYIHFVEIMERVKWQKYDWTMAHNYFGRIENIRLLAIRC